MVLKKAKDDEIKTSPLLFLSLLSSFSLFRNGTFREKKKTFFV